MASADQSAMRTNLGLGDAATKNTGTSSGTVAAGNDSRIVGAVQTSRTISAGTGLTGGGDLSANRTLTVNFGTTTNTVCDGNDARLTQSIVQTWGPGNYNIVHPFNGQPTRVFADIYLASGGGGGGGGGISIGSTVLGGQGGSMGIIRVIRNLYVGARSLYATIGTGGAGGTYAQGTSGDGGNGYPGTESSLHFNDDLFELIAKCPASDLSNTGGSGGGASYYAPKSITGNHDATVSQTWFAGFCDANGSPIAPSNIDVYNGGTSPITPFIANPLLACGGAGGGVSNAGAGNDGGEGMDLWGFAYNAGVPTTRFGKLTGIQDATDLAIIANGDNATRLAFFNRGLGGSGGAAANMTYSTDDQTIGMLRAGNGSKGSPGCGGGGGGGFYCDGNQTVRSGVGGAGGDGFLVIIWRRAD